MTAAFGSSKNGALLCILMLAALPAPGLTQQANSFERLEIDLITVGPGAAYWERFGHNMILVRDPEDGTAITYNYGIFDFRQKNFLLNFLRGKMSYRLAAFYADQDLPDYIAADRSVVSQRLNLNGAETRRLVEFLETNRLPENAAYRYDYFRSNCSTRVRDALDLALDGALAANFTGQASASTFRDFTNRYAAPRLWMYVATQLALARPTDRPISRWEAFFIPAELLSGAAETVLQSTAGEARRLVAETRVLHRSAKYQVLPDAPAWTHWFLLAGCGFAGLIWFAGSARRQRLLASSWWTASALLGIAMLAVWTLTAHDAAHGNENLLIFSPLGLIPAIAWLRGPPSPPVAFGLAALVVLPLLAAAGLAATPWLVQHNREFLAFAIPIHAVAALAFYRAAVADQSKLPG